MRLLEVLIFLFSRSFSSQFSEGRAIRVSKSQSRVFPDGRFVIVYRSDQQQSPAPVSLSRHEAVEVAHRFRSATSGDESKNINLAAAQFIYDTCREKGWLAEEMQTGSNVNAAATATASATQTLASNLQAEQPMPTQTSAEPALETAEQSTSIHRARGATRKHFPFLAATQQPKIEDAAIEDIAFVLHGVNPAKRIDPAIVKQFKSVKELRGKADCRIDPVSELLEDHRYVLQDLHQLPTPELRTRWLTAMEISDEKTVNGLAKLWGNIEKLSLDPVPAALSSPQGQAFMKAVRHHALSLLATRFQAARHQIETHQQGGDQPKSGLWSRIRGKSASKARTPSNTVPVSDEEREIAAQYLHSACRLGRLLRIPR